MLLVFSWSGFYYTLDMMGKLSNYPSLAYTNFLTDFMYNPLVYIYVLRLTHKGYKFSKKSLTHFIPTAIMFIYYFNYYFAPPDTKEEIFARGYNYFPNDVAVFSYINLVQFIIYLSLSAVILQKYGKRITQYYSDIERRNHEWIKYILIINVLTAVLCFFLYRTGWNIFGETISIISALLIYSIGYKMVSAPPFLPDFEIKSLDEKNNSAEIMQAPDITSKYKRSGLREELSKQFAAKLEEYMIAHKPYLDSELNLKQLADQLNIPPHQLSQVINQQFSKNFYDYINAFRVKEVKSRIKNPKYNNITLLGIGMDSGFNSKASFNNVFKKFTGKSPSEYKRENSAAETEITQSV